MVTVIGSVIARSNINAAEVTAEVNDVGTLGSTKTRLMIIGSDGSHCLQSHSKLAAPVNGLADPSGHHFAAEGFSCARG